MGESMNFGDERLPERFWKYVQPCPMSGCWLWGGPKHYYKKETKNWRRGTNPRRVPYDALYGDSTTSNANMVLSACGVDICCNPQHVQRRDNPRDDAERDRRDLNWRLRKHYGIDVETRDRMLQEQRGRCAICSRTFGSTPYTSPCVDHCHRTGKVRGLLCRKCNAGIGSLREDLFILANAATYLFKHNGPPRAGVELEKGDPGYGPDTHQ